MKEIAYEGVALRREEEEWQKKKAEHSRGSTAAPTVRTFRTDVESLLKKNVVTKTEVVMKEAERREARGESRLVHEKTEEHEQSYTRMILALALLLAFVSGVGAYAIFGAGMGSREKENQPTAPTPQSVQDREIAQITLSNAPREQILADLTIAFEKSSLTTNTRGLVTFIGAHNPAHTDEFLTSVLYRTPRPALLRSLESEFTYAAYADGDTLLGALLFTSRSYELTFAEMLEWERSLAEDLLPVLHPLLPRNTLDLLRHSSFSDARIGNIDARVLADASGDVFLAYALPDKKQLIIAGSPGALILEAERAR